MTREPDPAYFQAYFGTARHALLDLLVESAPLEILEIGCGSGANLVEMKRRHPYSHTTGVEIDQRAAEVASHAAGVDELISGNVLDTEAVHFKGGRFDLIILSHVLEHFAAPGQVLTRCHNWLKADGRMLVALPNVRHAVVMKQLLIDGDFRYEDAGILDRTHLRFYTRRSAERMLETEGYRVLRVAADIEGRRSRLLDRATLGRAREFAAFAYNFLVAKA